MPSFNFKWYVACITLALALQGANVYKDTDENGEVTFSDVPTPTSESVVLEPPNTTHMVQVSPKRTSDKEAREEANKHMNYNVSILSPKNEESFANGVMKVTLVVDVTPTLRKGHSLQLFHQGAPIGEPQRQKKFLIENLTRGAHQFYVEVIDSSGRSMGQSPTVTVYQQRPSIYLPKNPNHP